MRRRRFFAFACGSLLLACSPAKPLPRILLIGDSTVASYPLSRTPLAGWGQALTTQLADRAEVLNFAQPGNSTRRFATEHWQKVHSKIVVGDTLLIQFGHVDATSDPSRQTEPTGLYRTLLTQFVTQAQAAGARAILVTPIAQCLFESGQVHDPLDRYRDVMRQVALVTGAHLIDLGAVSARHMTQVGENKARLWFMATHDGVDNIHLNNAGATVFAQWVAADPVLAAMRQ